MCMLTLIGMVAGSLLAVITSKMDDTIWSRTPSIRKIFITGYLDVRSYIKIMFKAKSVFLTYSHCVTEE
jgi:hypothetical protein